MAEQLVFLLSPARTDGKRAQLLLRRAATFPLALRVQSPAGAPLGEVFTFTSELYFRGKLAYASAFAQPPPGCAGVQVVTAGRGLLPADTLVTAAELRAMAQIEVDHSEPRFCQPLLADARTLASRIDGDGRVVQLGSIATD